MKAEQDRTLPADEIYIRRALEYKNLDSSDSTDLEEASSDISGTIFRVIVCMLPQASHALLHAQCLQSDIAFKRVVGFEEFELGALDLVSRTSQYIIHKGINWYNANTCP